MDNFWKAWQQQDYTKAAQAVIPEQKSAFLRVRKFPVRKWKLERLEAGSQPGRIRVTVAVERFEPFMGRYFEWNHVAEWMESGSQWLLIMPSIR